jgi:RND superfamily putative drug exporter
VETLPDSLEAKEGFLLLENEFSPGILSPTQIVIDGDVSTQSFGNRLANLENELKNTPHVQGVISQIEADERIAIVTVTTLAAGSSATDVIEQIRSLPSIEDMKISGEEVFVGGTDAGQADFTKIIRDYTPIVFTFVLSLSFLFLMVVFRSLVVPIKAIIMNLLSVGAAYGLLVLVFQKGVFADILGFQTTDQIEAWIPLFLFAILFGLSMDYHVFLLSRIRERFLQTGDNTGSVVFGLSTTGRLITGAALIMVAVFAGFASGELVMFQQMGFGLAVAILLDATIVRSILVPASMKLLGDRNWYLPSWLSWLPKIGIEG